ncbi:hypothetical protein B0H13DRAFT_1925806 [Mycena leptocephala]|nr:hypothetical protein B0H13DRAFT_1925806 [Mycena leptocephala]
MKLATKLLSALIQDVEIFESFEEILTAAGACRETETKVALPADAFLFLVSTSKHGGFPSAHLSQKIIAALVSALDALLPTAIQLIWPAIYRGMGTSMTYLPMGPAREAVETEFRRFIVSCAVKYARGPRIEGTDVYEELGWIMKTILAQSLVSCSVVTAIHSALKEAQSSPEMEKFAQVPFFSVWTTLATLVEQRARVLSSWKSAGSPCFLHIAEALITAGPTANRQIGAQVIGKFANLQNNITLIGLASNPFDKQFHRRDRAFMHALIDADYKKRLKRQISRGIISFMQAHPDSPSRHRRRAVCLVQKPAAACRLHRVWAGSTSQYILPLRESSTAFNAGLHRVAEEIPAEADESWVENKSAVVTVELGTVMVQKDIFLEGELVRID